MSGDFEGGIKTGLTIYGVGALLTIVVHIIFGGGNSHTPPISIIPFFMTLIAGGGRMLMVIFMLVKSGNGKAKEEFLVHAVSFVIVLIFITWFVFPGAAVL
jgi:hypothetical protein